MNDDEPILIDGMTLAYEAFQGCRHLVAGTEATLSMLVRTLPRLEERDAVAVEVPASWVRALDPFHQEVIMSPPGAVRARLVNRQLLPAIALGAGDLLRLWSAGSQPSIASLGYALHPLPRMVQTGERFEPERFRFGFRIAASSWDELSFEMREVLCGLVGIDQDEAQRKMAREGFVIDTFGFRREGERRA